MGGSNQGIPSVQALQVMGGQNPQAGSAPPPPDVSDFDAMAMSSARGGVNMPQGFILGTPHPTSSLQGSSREDGLRAETLLHALTLEEEALRSIDDQLNKSVDRLTVSGGPTDGSYGELKAMLSSLPSSNGNGASSNGMLSSSDGLKASDLATSDVSKKAETSWSAFLAGSGGAGSGDGGSFTAFARRVLLGGGTSTSEGADPLDTSKEGGEQDPYERSRSWLRAPMWRSER
jgi:hypothetical protein